jgi:hypothetical protein
MSNTQMKATFKTAVNGLMQNSIGCSSKSFSSQKKMSVWGNSPTTWWGIKFCRFKGVSSVVDRAAGYMSPPLLYNHRSLNLSHHYSEPPATLSANFERESLLEPYFRVNCLLRLTSLPLLSLKSLFRPLPSAEHQHLALCFFNFGATIWLNNMFLSR